MNKLALATGPDFSIIIKKKERIRHDIRLNCLKNVDRTYSQCRKKYENTLDANIYTYKYTLSCQLKR